MNQNKPSEIKPAELARPTNSAEKSSAPVPGSHTGWGGSRLAPGSAEQAARAWEAAAVKFLI